MAALARHFGIKPWEHDRLTIDQFLTLCEACDQIANGGGS